MAREDPVNANTRIRVREWAVGVVAAVLALAALVVGSEFGSTHGAHPRLVAWVSAAVLLVSGVIAVLRISTALSRVVERRSAPGTGGAARVLSSVIGYLFVALAVLAVLQVQSSTLVGAGVAGVVLGIAAQQSLGNVFAGLVLLLARPFAVGDHVRIRSGALGGIFEAWVRDMSLTYVTLQTEDGELKIPNSAMLAAGVGQLPGAAEGPDAVDGPDMAANDGPDVAAAKRSSAGAADPVPPPDR